MSVDLTETLCRTLIEVVADLSFTCLTEHPGGDLPSEAGRQMRATLPVHQPLAGIFALTVESRLMQEITCNIYGFEGEEIAGECQADTLLELINTIGGRFMQVIVPPTIGFELGLPVMGGPATGRDGAGSGSEPVLNLVFGSDEGYLVFSLIGSNLIDGVNKEYYLKNK